MTMYIKRNLEILTLRTQGVQPPLLDCNPDIPIRYGSWMTALYSHTHAFNHRLRQVSPRFQIRI